VPSTIASPQRIASTNNNSIPLPTTITLPGTQIPKNQVSITQHHIPDSTFAEQSQLKTLRTYSQKTVPFEGNPKEISFGKGNFLPITTVPLGTPIKHQIEPARVQALPFQNVMLEKLSYQSIGRSQGLKSAFVTAVFEDSRGYFWFGGRRGLTRYDGQIFYFYPFANEGQHRGIGAITEDSGGNIWMSFGSFGGLMEFGGAFVGNQLL
jgi:hypothetical protein